MIQIHYLVFAKTNLCVIKKAKTVYVEPLLAQYIITSIYKIVHTMLHSRERDKSSAKANIFSLRITILNIFLKQYKSILC